MDVFLDSVRRFNKVIAQIERGEIASDVPLEPPPHEHQTEHVNNSRIKEPSEKQQQQKPEEIKLLKKAFKDPRQIQHPEFRLREIRNLRDSTHPTRPLPPIKALPEKKLELTKKVLTSPPIYATINLVLLSDEEPDSQGGKSVDDVEHMTELLDAVNTQKRQAKPEELPALELKEKRLRLKNNIMNKPTVNQPNFGFTYVEQEGAPMFNVEKTPNSTYYNVTSNDIILIPLTSTKRQ